MNPVVNTYYEHIDGFDDDVNLLGLWKVSWENNGWKTRVLTFDDAKRHKNYNKYADRFSTLPTINNKQYEIARFNRWFAMACIGGYMSDYDVINHGLRPFDKPNSFTLFESRCTSFVFGKVRDYNFCLDMFYRFNEVCSHISDQYIINQIHAHNIDEKVEQFEKPSGKKLIHYSNHSMRNNKPRSKYITI